MNQNSVQKCIHDFEYQSSIHSVLDGNLLEVEIELLGQEPKAKAWQIDLRKLAGGTPQRFWVAPDGRMLKISYGGAFAYLSTREEALSGLPKGVGPQTAKK